MSPAEMISSNFFPLPSDFVPLKHVSLTEIKDRVRLGFVNQGEVMS